MKAHVPAQHSTFSEVTDAWLSSLRNKCDKVLLNAVSILLTIASLSV